MEAELRTAQGNGAGSGARRRSYPDLHGPNQEARHGMGNLRWRPPRHQEETTPRSQAGNTARTRPSPGGHPHATRRTVTELEQECQLRQRRTRSVREKFVAERGRFYRAAEFADILNERLAARDAQHRASLQVVRQNVEEALHQINFALEQSDSQEELFEIFSRRQRERIRSSTSAQEQDIGAARGVHRPSQSQ